MLDCKVGKRGKMGGWVMGDGRGQRKQDYSESQASIPLKPSKQVNCVLCKPTCVLERETTARN